ncbi:MAG: MFS transporter [Bacteroidales bacterium]|nr:MFS transporter [Bacteroidales bacterium]
MSKHKESAMPQQTAGVSAMRILIALSILHLANDALQSAISASYPVLKSEMQLTFRQIGLITLAYQISASVFQPVVGIFFDRRPWSRALPMGMLFTLVGLASLAFARTPLWAMASVFITGIGSSTLHPEASRLTSLASGGRRGFAQSLFQVGGNLGGAIGPLLVAIIVAPYGQRNIVWLTALALMALMVAQPVSRWYRKQLTANRQVANVRVTRQMPLSPLKTVVTITILLVLIFSKYVYMSCLSSYYTFYLLEKFGVSVAQSQIFLFVFLLATAIGTMLGGPVGDRIGRKYVIWISIVGAAPFALLMPHTDLLWTVIMSFCSGLMLSSAFPAILLYAQELLPYKLGMVSGLFFGLAFGIAGISSAVLGKIADVHGIETIYRFCAYAPLLGMVAWLLPDLKRK